MASDEMVYVLSEESLRVALGLAHEGMDPDEVVSEMLMHSNIVSVDDE